MQKKYTFIAGTLGLIIGVVIAITLQTQASLPVIDNPEVQPMPSLAPMLKRTNMSVVNISVSQTQTARNPLLEDPFFRHFFNIPDNYQPQQRETKSAGSGVIIDADKGIVITNHHVVKDANKISVSLNDGRSNIDATLIGSDPEVDIAILKIKAKNLSSIPMANSDALNVGDFAVAIGNPFGLGQTVTTGIVSALGRTGLGIQGYENFIQTDASINPGNSGGALVNLRGELIGINTAIIAPSGGNVGIGFAIPSNMVKYSMEQILKHGKVSRGQLGVYIQELTPELAQAFGTDKNMQGIIITRVAESSPAAKAGVKEGDIVIDIDGKTVQSAGQLRNLIGLKQPGEKIQLGLVRNNKKLVVPVAIEQDAFQKNAAINNANMGGDSIFSGASLQDTRDGVLITQIAPNSPAALSGLLANDLIIGANRQRVTTAAELHSIVKRSSSQVLLQIQRDGATLFLVYRR